MYRPVVAKKSPEKCPDCGADVLLKSEYHNGGHYLVLYNPDESKHWCQTQQQPFEKHPIGQAVIGKTIKNYQLRGRVLTITLEDGNVLSVFGAGQPLTIHLKGPAGIMQE